MLWLIAISRRFESCSGQLLPLRSQFVIMPFLLLNQNSVGLPPSRVLYRVRLQAIQLNSLLLHPDAKGQSSQIISTAVHDLTNRSLDWEKAFSRSVVWKTDLREIHFCSTRPRYLKIDPVPLGFQGLELHQQKMGMLLLLARQRRKDVPGPDVNTLAGSIVVESLADDFVVNGTL